MVLSGRRSGGAPRKGEPALRISAVPSGEFPLLRLEKEERSSFSQAVSLNDDLKTALSLSGPS